MKCGLQVLVACVFAVSAAPTFAEGAVDSLEAVGKSYFSLAEPDLHIEVNGGRSHKNGYDVAIGHVFRSGFDVELFKTETPRSTRLGQYKAAAYGVRSRYVFAGSAGVKLYATVGASRVRFISDGIGGDLSYLSGLYGGGVRLMIGKRFRVFYEHIVYIDRDDEPELQGGLGGFRWVLG